MSRGVPPHSFCFLLFFNTIDIRQRSLNGVFDPTPQFIIENNENKTNWRVLWKKQLQH